MQLKPPAVRGPHRILVVALVAAAVSVTATVGVLAGADYAYRAGYFDGTHHARHAERATSSDRPTVIVPGAIEAHARTYLATDMVFRYAHEAFGAWATAHLDATCPASLRELHPYLERVDSIDPWGHAYRFACLDGGITVWSLGADGVEDTDDDLRSLPSLGRRR